mmetsp:Transcript_63206/g.142809  ORF Transcript_63206/g.142809 Transcript_63206/m.142809 type:complete len:227 (+) Transcript_63206:68-748(+)
MSEGPELAPAIHDAIAAHPEGAEAGPKALLTAVQAANPDFSGVSLPKFKRELAKVKAVLKEEAEKAAIEAAKPKVGTALDCPGRHGLARFLTNHASYCCDTCRCYLPIGAPMWGCRACDWDVCEGRCRPKVVTIEELKASLSGVESRIEELCQENPEDMKTQLALQESKIHQLEKQIDNAAAKDLAEASKFKMEEEEARQEKKTLLATSERLLQKVEGVFATLKGA